MVPYAHELLYALFERLNGIWIFRGTHEDYKVAYHNHNTQQKFLINGKRWLPKSSYDANMFPLSIVLLFMVIALLTWKKTMRIISDSLWQISKYFKQHFVWVLYLCNVRKVDVQGWCCRLYEISLIYRKQLWF